MGDALSMPWLVYAAWLFAGGSALFAFALCLYWAAQRLRGRIALYLSERRGEPGGGSDG